jgi:hypothetical protein
MENFKRMWTHPAVITAALAATGLSAFILTELVSGGLVSAMRRDYPDNVSLKALEGMYPSNWSMIAVYAVCVVGLSFGLIGLYHTVSRLLYRPGRPRFNELNNITENEVRRLQAELEVSNVTIEKVGKVWR